MKKLLPILCFLVFAKTNLWSQCAPTCSNYVLSSISFSTFPNTGNVLNSTFNPNDDDGLTGPIPLGFNFNFYCGTYSQVIIGSNGFLSFDVVNPINASTSQTSQFLPNSSSPNGLVCYNWNDLDVSAGGQITYTTIGTSPNRMFILTYTNVPIWNTTYLNNGQIVLYETSDIIEVHSGLISLSPYPGTQGIENLSGTLGNAVSGWNNSTWTATNTAYRWQKAVVGTPPTGLAGNTVVCSGDPLIYTINSMSTASSYSWSLPNGWSGGGTNTAISATAGVSGNLSVTATYTCGVSAPALISVTVNPPPYINITNVSPPTICSGSVVQIDATGGVSYTLDPGGITGVTPFTITAMANTVYSLTGSTAFGCVSPSPVIVPLTVNQSPTVTTNSGAICLGQSFTISPTGAASYSYSSLFSVVTPSFVGTYSYQVVGTSASACLGYAVSNVTVNALPSTNAVASRTAMCVDETVSLTASGANSYTWTNTGATTTVISVSPSSSTTYTVNGINSAGCKKSATVAIVVNFCTGIDEQGVAEAAVMVYPNPSNGEFTLRTWAQVNITVLDINGKEIINSGFEEGTHKINLEQYPQGVYFLTARYGSKEEHFKIMKE